LEILDAPKVLVSDLPWLKRIFGRSSSDLSQEARDFATRIHLQDKREFDILRSALTQKEQAVEQQVEQALRLLGTGLDNWWQDHGPTVIREIRAFQRQLIDMLQSLTYIYSKPW